MTCPIIPYTSAIFENGHFTEFHPLLPDKVTGLHLTMLRTCIFGSEDTITNTYLKRYVWDSSSTNIQIAPYGSDTKKVEIKPSIIVKRGVWTTEMVGFRHNAGVPYTDEDTGLTYQWQLTAIPGTTEIYFIGNTDGEAEALAGEVFWWFLENRARIEVYFGFHTFELAELAPLQVYKEDFKDLLATKFTLRYNIWHRYNTVIDDGGSG